MTIGLFDEDFKVYSPFNLELMKLAHYYKQRMEITILSDKFDPTRYTTFYYRHDLDPFVARPLYLYKNIEPGGRHFATKYVPLPLEIEYSDYDETIYEKFYNAIEGRRRLFGNTMQHCYHTRLSLDGENYDPALTKFNRLDTKPKLMFHDYDICQIKDYKDIVQEYYDRISNKGNVQKALGLKYPPQITNIEEINWWGSFKHISRSMPIQYNGILTYDDINYLKETQKKYTKVFYNPTYNTDEDTFLSKTIYDIFDQAVYLHNKRIQIALINEKGFFSKSAWDDVMTLIGHYMYSQNHVYDKETFYAYCKKLANSSERQWYLVSRAFLFVAKENPELFKMFYEYLN